MVAALNFDNTRTSLSRTSAELELSRGATQVDGTAGPLGFTLAPFAGLTYSLVLLWANADLQHSVTRRTMADVEPRAA